MLDERNTLPTPITNDNVVNLFETLKNINLCVMVRELGGMVAVPAREEEIGHNLSNISLDGKILIIVNYI